MKNIHVLHVGIPITPNHHQMHVIFVKMVRVSGTILEKYEKKRLNMTEVLCYNWDCKWNNIKKELCTNAKITISNGRAQCITKKKTKIIKDIWE